jgi:hypothetical protein
MTTIEQSMMEVLPIELISKIFTNTPIETRLAIRAAHPLFRINTRIKDALILLATAIANIYCYMLTSAKCADVTFYKFSLPADDMEVFFEPDLKSMVALLSREIEDGDGLVRSSVNAFLPALNGCNDTYEGFCVTMELVDCYIATILDKLAADLNTQGCFKPQKYVYYIFANIDTYTSMQIKVSDGFYSDVIHIKVYGLRGWANTMAMADIAEANS